MEAPRRSKRCLHPPTTNTPNEGAGGKAEAVVRKAFLQPGPALIQAVVDPNEPPLPGKITTQQASKFAEALLKGEPDRFTIIKDVLGDRVREVV